MIRRTLRRTLIAVTALSVVVIGAPADAHNVREGNVRFKVVCSFSHSLPDDPIVHPNLPGASHLHDFLGRQGVNASTTTFSDLVNGDERTRCDDPADLSAYWAPALYADGVKVDPSGLGAYYRLNGKHGTLQPYPDGLKIVSDQNGWQCDAGRVSSPTDCPAHLKLRVDFPDCWDGVNLDSADHRSHMAFALPSGDHNACPATHPVAVPRLTTYINYDLPAPASSITLASGAASGPNEQAHADFFNGWERDRLAERIETCLHGLQRCDSGA